MTLRSVDNEYASEAEIRMSEVLASVDPTDTSLVLVAHHDTDGYEIFSRYSNFDTGMLLLRAAQRMLAAEGEHEDPLPENLDVP